MELIMTENFVFSIMFGVVFGISYLSIMLLSNIRGAVVVKYLTEIGATDITIRYRVFRSDWYHSAWYVTYKDAVGRTHETVCTVRRFFWLTPKLLWDDQPQVASKQGDDTEQIISDLMSENAQLRSKLQTANIKQ